MTDFGDIVLARFPFTDLSGSKVRPALVVSKDNDRRTDVILAFITSSTNAASFRDAMPILPDAANGLKVSSAVRFDKIVTLEKRIVASKLGSASATFLSAATPVFHAVLASKALGIAPVTFRMR